MKALAHILTSAATKDRLAACAQTWGGLLPWVAYADYAEPHTVFQTSTDSSRIPGVYLRLREWMRSMPEAVLEYDWHLFVDDDTLVFPKHLRAFIARIERCKPAASGKFFGHAIALWPDEPMLAYLSGGAGILVPSCVLSSARRQAGTFYYGGEIPPSDVWLTRLLCASGGRMTPMNHLFNPGRALPDITLLPGTVTLHYLEPKQMVEVWGCVGGGQVLPQE